jgi:hypothetical protein
MLVAIDSRDRDSFRRCPSTTKMSWHVMCRVHGPLPAMSGSLQRVAGSYQSDLPRVFIAPPSMTDNEKDLPRATDKELQERIERLKASVAEHLAEIERRRLRQRDDHEKKTGRETVDPK